MFEGDGFGVGLTVQQLDVPGVPGPGGWVPPGDRDWHPTRLSEVMPAATRSEAGLALEMRRTNVLDARLWAHRVDLAVQLAVHRRADRDRPAEKPGAAAPGWAQSSWVLEGFSEFLVDEVAAINNVSRGEASRFLAVALTLGHRLADTWAALADGELTWSRARALAEEVNRCGPDVDPHVVATVEAVVLPEAAELSVTALRARVRAEFVRRDAEAADQRRRQALTTADVFLRRTGDEGMSEVVTRLPHEAAAAMLDAIDSAARAAKAAGDQRPIGIIRAEAQANRTLRPWDTSRPAVTARLTILATLNALLPDPAVPGGGGTPTGMGEVDGEPVTAAHLRALLAALDAIGPGGLRAPPDGSLQLDLIGGGGNLLATLTRPELEAAVRRGCPEHGGAAADCRCPLAGPPAGHRRLRAHRGPAPVPDLPRPRLPAPRLPRPGRLGRPRPRPPARRGRGHRLRQPVLPVPPPPPAQDLRPGLGLHPRRRRQLPGHHPHRRHPHQPTTGQLPARTLRIRPAATRHPHHRRPTLLRVRAPVRRPGGPRRARGSSRARAAG